MRIIHSKIDADRDGEITLPEVLDFSTMMRHTLARKEIATVLREMDTDKDGKLNLDDVLRHMELWGEDGEKDGQAVAQKELEIAKFRTADQNQDGLLDSEELPSLFHPEFHDGILEMTAAVTLKAKDTNGDGTLSPEEFWEAEDGEDLYDLTLSEEELEDFQKLDVDASGSLDLKELKAWESGSFHADEAMKKLFELADEDGDLMVDVDEFKGVRKHILGRQDQYTLMQWAEHAEL